MISKKIMVEIAEQVMADSPGAKMIPGKTFCEHFTQFDEYIYFWYNDPDNSTAVFRKSIREDN